jgi:hypothetical protein
MRAMDFSSALLAANQEASARIASDDLGQFFLTLDVFQIPWRVRQ